MAIIVYYHDKTDLRTVFQHRIPTRCQMNPCAL